MPHRCTSPREGESSTTSAGRLSGARSGDLRIGLALQSVHDGTDWYHEPWRLSVFIEAPVNHIERVLAAHEVVRHLVDNRWVHLLRIDATHGQVERREGGAWVAVA